MQCIQPYQQPRPNGRGKLDTITHGCGHCPQCLETRRAEWSFRLSQELKAAHTAHFITLTYADDTLPWANEEPTLDKNDIRLFKARLRKEQVKMIHNLPYKEITRQKLSKASNIKYYTVGEYGERTNRPHYHSIMFNLKPKLEYKIPEIWQKGNIYIGKVTPASIHYVTSYIVGGRSEYSNGKLSEFAMISNKMGVEYMKNQSYHKPLEKDYVQLNGYKQKMPRYYKEKLKTIHNWPEKPDILNPQPNIWEQNLKRRKLANQKEQEKINKLINKGIDPITYLEQEQSQFINKLNKSKKAKFL